MRKDPRASLQGRPRHVPELAVREDEELAGGGEHGLQRGEEERVQRAQDRALAEASVDLLQELLLVGAELDASECEVGALEREKRTHGADAIA
eukprot:894330-Rhodomonas_salina.2